LLTHLRLNPVEFILAANITRRHLTAGQCAVIVAPVYPDPEKGGRGKSTNYSKLEGFSVSRLSEARMIVRHPRDLADQVIKGSCTFKQALDEATASRISYADPMPYGTLTKGGDRRRVGGPDNYCDTAPQ